MDRCEQCGRKYNRPSFYKDCEKIHGIKPTLAQRIVEDIEKDLNDRRGLRS